MPFTMVGTKTIFMPVARQFSMTFILVSSSARPRVRQVNVVGDAVELQVERGQPGFLRFLGEFQIGQLDAVGRRLNVGEAHLARHAEDLEELRMNGGLAAGELHHPAIHRALAAQRLQHGADLLNAGLVEIAGDVGVGEADRAGQVAAVGEIDIGERGVRGVHAAQAAIVGTRLSAFDLRIGEPEIVAEVPLLHLEVEFDVAEDDVAKAAMLGAGLLHHHLAVVGEDIRRDDLIAFRTE